MRGFIRGVTWWSAAAEGDEVSKWVGQGRVEGLEGEGLRGVEACGLGSVEVHEGCESGERLVDRCPAYGSFVAVVVWGVDALGEGCELVGDGLLEKIVGHLFLTGGD